MLRIDFFFSSRRRHTRLVSDWSSDVCSSDLGRQSKFLIDALYPALEGIRAKYSRNYDCHRWRKLVSAAVRQDDYRQLSIDSTSLECWLSGIYHNPEKTNELLLEKSPLRYFYKLKSPLNH